MPVPPGPLGSISGTVWDDSAGGDGIMETGEPKIANRQVLLYSEYDNRYIKQTTTNATGNYSFSVLRTNNYYKVAFANATGYRFSPLHAPGSTLANDSDVEETVSTGIGFANVGKLTSSISNISAGVCSPTTPIKVFQDHVYATAQHRLIDEMDFSDIAKDVNAYQVHAVIVQQPSHGTLTYDTQTKLYKYTALAYYTGLDQFVYKLASSTSESQSVTVSLLANEGVLEPYKYDSFPLIAKNLYNGNPDPKSVAQGNISDCWFLAAVVDIASIKPTDLKDRIKHVVDGEYYVTISGYPKDTEITYGALDSGKYSSANGDWLAVLEKGYGQTVYNSKSLTWGWQPYDYIDSGNFCDAGITPLTGHESKSKMTWCTKIEVLRKRIADAMTEKRIVTASVAWRAASDGLVDTHVYSVLEYDATKDSVRIRNPHGKNPVISRNGDDAFHLGKNDADNNPGTNNNNGYFWMSMTEFKEKFAIVAYELSPPKFPS
jgi:hypothetical protein